MVECNLDLLEPVSKKPVPTFKTTVNRDKPYRKYDKCTESGYRKERPSMGIVLRVAVCSYSRDVDVRRPTLAYRQHWTEFIVSNRKE